MTDPVETPDGTEDEEARTQVSDEPVADDEPADEPDVEELEG